MRSKTKIPQQAVTYATCGTPLNVLKYLLKPIKNYKMMMFLLGIAPLMLLSGLTTKQLRIFLSSDTIEHTQKTKEKSKKNF